MKGDRKNRRKNRYRRGFLLLVIAIVGLSTHGLTELIAKGTNKEVGLTKWQEFHSAVGNCKIALPQPPHHVHDTMTLPDNDSELQYDVYIAAEQQAVVYMVMVAEYPKYIDESYAELSLENFLNGLLSQSPHNRLVFADLIEFDGHKGMDFFIQTEGIYFKGRAIMANHRMYLLAMECDGRQYQDISYKHFIHSFVLIP